MNKFVLAARKQPARTTNGMKAQKSTADNVVDLFANIGALRGKDVIPQFVAAYAEDRDLATRVALWARDIRGGAGERKVFRDILKYLYDNDRDRYNRVIRRVPDLGRWDDLLTIPNETNAYKLIAEALESGNGLAAKWMPRKGEDAVKLRKFLRMSPKQYRKTLVELTKVVESQMCANDWDNINFNHVPSLASSRYKKAFARHTDKYKEWTEKLVSTDPKVREQVKVNAGAVYPYDVLKGVIGHYRTSYTKDQLNHVKAQWDALPNFVGDANILPLVDVSGSMTSRAGGYSSQSVTTCLDVAVSLGLYLADKNKGVVKDTFLTFSSRPELLHLKGDILQKVTQMVSSNWDMSTNLHAAIEKILDTAIAGNVPEEDMPRTLLILSDMQFNACARYDDSAIQMIKRKYEKAGYTMPQIVFWNLNAAYGNQPVSFNDQGVALVSGFSPAIVKSVLGNDLQDFTPRNVMLKTIMNERYNY